MPEKALCSETIDAVLAAVADHEGHLDSPEAVELHDSTSIVFEEIEFLQIRNCSPDVGKHFFRGPMKSRRDASRYFIERILSVAQVPDHACGSIEPVHVPTGAIQDDHFFIDNSGGESRAR